MNDIERGLLEALQTLDQTVAALRHANPKPDLLPLFARLEELTRQLPRDTDPTLLHYLHRKSYEKARHFLEEQVASS